jgi:hypothetical protein
MTRSVRFHSTPILAYPASRAAMSGTFGKNFFNPDYEWGFMTVRIIFLHRDTRMTLVPRSCCSRFLKRTATAIHSIGRGKLVLCTRRYLLAVL